jgi:hypothetical protein
VTRSRGGSSEQFKQFTGLTGFPRIGRIKAEPHRREKNSSVPGSNLNPVDPEKSC